MRTQQIYRWLVSGHSSFFLACLLFIAFCFLKAESLAGQDLIRMIVAIVVGIGTALLIQYVNNHFMLIKARSNLPAIFYLLLLSANNHYADMLDYGLGLMLVLCLLQLFYSYQESQVQVWAYNISILISIAAIFWFPVFALIPLVWYGLSYFQSLNARSFFATLLGVCTVAFVLTGWAVYTNDAAFLAGLLPDWQLFTHFALPDWELPQYILAGFIAFLFIISSLQLIMPGKTDRIRTKFFLEYLFVFALILFLLLAAFPIWLVQWEALLFVPLAFLFARFFTVSSKKRMVWTLLVSLLFLLGLAVYMNVGHLAFNL